MKTRFKSTKPPAYTPGPPGYAFKGGKLYWFCQDFAVVVSVWPDPRCWAKRPGHGWQASRELADRLLCSFNPYEPPRKPDPPEPLPDANPPPEPPVKPGRQSRRSQRTPAEQAAADERSYRIQVRMHRYLTAYFATMPPRIRALVLQFPRRRWHVLSLLARCPGAADLAAGNPALLYALASNWIFRKPVVKDPIRAARALVNRKQRDILAWLKFPATEPVRRIFAKIPAECADIERLLHLRKALRRRGTVKRLSHVRRINQAVMRLVSEPDLIRHVTPRLLYEIGETSVRENGWQGMGVFVDLVRDTAAMARMRDGFEGDRRFTSIKRLRHVHDAMRNGLDHLVFKQPDLGELETAAAFCRSLDMPDRFPEPPFPGTSAIVPILTPAALVVEGHTMRHCAGAHGFDVLEGREYVYQVFEPQRATFSIRRDGDRWWPDQLCGPSNQRLDIHLCHDLYKRLLRSAPRPPRAPSNQLEFPLLIP